MRTIVRVVCLAMLAAIVAVPAGAGPLRGACWVWFDQDFDDTTELEVAVCIDYLTEFLCSELQEGEIETQFDRGLLCTEVDFPYEWEGACNFTVGDDETAQGEFQLCGVVWVEDHAEYDSQYFCEFDGGEWLGDDSICELVPAVPDIGLWVLALLMAAGGLLFVLRVRRLASR